MRARIAELRRSPDIEPMHIPSVTVRGPERRQRLVEATVRILVRGGVGDVSHRTVSEEARLPTTATTYYFATLDALLAETFRALFETFITKPESRGAVGRAVAEDPVADVVDGFLEVIERRESTSRVLWELLLAASRRADMKAFPHLYWASQIDLLSEQLSVDPDTSGAVIALMDGYMLAFLTTRQLPSRERLIALVRSIVSAANEEPAARSGPPVAPRSVISS